MSASPEEVQRGVAEQLAAHQPDTWRWLLDQHVADDTGHCAACQLSSRGAPVWPCTLRVVAELAQELSEAAAEFVHTRRTPHTG